MTAMRRPALVLLAAVYACALAADWIAPASYDRQHRDHPAAAPSAEFPLGTDALGRDRLSRLLHGSRVSLLLAPAAALLSTLLAVFLGGVAAFAGGRWERLLTGAADLTLSLPWLFLLLAVRALLPLNVAPVVSVAITFGLLGLLGWAGPARVVRAGVRQLRDADFVLAARASGRCGLRLVARELAPNLRPVLTAQFWVAIPVFILSEANLGLLGLGVAEPLPSWGGLLRELENPAAWSQPWMLAPAVLLGLVVGSFEMVLPREDLNT